MRIDDITNKERPANQEQFSEQQLEQALKAKLASAYSNVKPDPQLLAVILDGMKHLDGIQQQPHALQRGVVKQGLFARVLSWLEFSSHSKVFISAFAVLLVVILASTRAVVIRHSAEQKINQTNSGQQQTQVSGVTPDVTGATATQAEPHHSTDDIDRVLNNEAEQTQAAVQGDDQDTQSFSNDTESNDNQLVNDAEDNANAIQR